MTAPSERNILPSDPFPVHYDLRIHPNFTDFNFKGYVKIQCEKSADLAEVSQLVLNAVDIKVFRGSVSNENQQEIFKFADTDVVYDERNGRITIACPTPIKSTTFFVEISYQGEISNKMSGFYRSTYKNDKGEQKVMGVTQFESVDARRALPCWDEPSHKATFQVTIQTPEGLSALSNTKAERETELESGDVEITFAKTPKMSTYLLAWAIGEFEMIETAVPKAKDASKSTRLRVYTRPGKKSQAEFALAVGAKVLPLIEKFFDQEWFLDKNDMIAVPDFAAGAMENWGLITYRETALLCDAKSAAKTKEWVALVVAHENVHFFFGNKVTMEWWDGLWLNESFTTFVEYYLVDVMFPEWQVFTQFVFDEAGRAMDLDAREASHPIQVPVKNAEEIDEIFDVISYSKGCSILRMLSQYIGMDAFRAGIQLYQNAFAFKNATTEDLLKYLSEASGKDLVSIMSSWIFKQGFPVLTVTKSTRNNSSNNMISIAQRRYLSQPSSQETAAKDETLWSIPLKILSEKSHDVEKAPFELMTERAAEFDLGSDGNSWVKVNGNQAAFVRVHYADADLLHGLKKPIADQTLNAVDRFAVLADLHAFAQTGIASTATALDFAKSYVDDEDATVWCAVTAFESDVRRLLLGESQELKDAFDAYARGLYAKIVEKVGFVPNPEKDNHRSASLRAMVFARAAAVKDAKATTAALAQWDDLITNGKEVPADLRAAIYGTALRERGRDAFTKLKELHAQASDDASEAIRIVRILGTVKGEDLCKEAAEYCLSDAVRAQDAFVTLVALSGNEDGQKIFEQLLIDDFDRIWNKFPGMIITRVVKAIENMFDVSAGERVLAFLKTLPEQKSGQIMRSALQGVEGMKLAHEWKARDLKAIREFLSA